MGDFLLTGGVYSYSGEGQQWEYAGAQAGVSQVYSFCAYEGELYCGTWPEARIFRKPRGVAHDAEWEDVGATGEEKEIMGMCVYNGKM